MKAFLSLAALLPLVASVPSTGSYASFSHHGHSYGYGHNHEHAAGAEEPLYYHNKPHEAAHAAPHHAAPHHAAPHHAAPHHEPAYHHPAPAYKAHEPAYHHPAPAYHQPSYGYEQPKHNCSVQDVTEEAEVCTPAFETVCENVDLAIKQIVDGEYCYDVSRTVCSESIEEIDNEVCSYSYERKYEDTTAQTVEVTFVKETNTQMVTVCQPGYGHGYHAYGHQYCKEVAQETAYNVPVVTPVDVDVKVAYPEPIKSCVNKPISLPRISCEVLTEEKCVSQPEVEEAIESVEKCVTQLAEPACQKVELTLPKQVCVELVYGYAEEVPESYTQ